MNKVALSPKQERWAQAYAQHHNASRACRESGYSAGCASVTGTRLLASRAVSERIQVLDAANAVDMGITRQRFLAELGSAAALAKASGEPMAMIAAWREIGKACSYYSPERVEVALDVSGQVELGRLNSLSDAELLRIIEAGRAR